MKKKFKVQHYSCRAEELQESMNKHFEDGYYPKEIQLEQYQDLVIGFIIYEFSSKK